MRLTHDAAESTVGVLFKGRPCHRATLRTVLLYNKVHTCTGGAAIKSPSFSRSPGAIYRKLPVAAFKSFCSRRRIIGNLQRIPYCDLLSSQLLCVNEEKGSGCSTPPTFSRSPLHPLDWSTQLPVPRAPTRSPVGCAAFAPSTPYKTPLTRRPSSPSLPYHGGPEQLPSLVQPAQV